jgi:hypothetical protein
MGRDWNMGTSLMREAGGIWSREIDLTPIWRDMRDHPAGVIVGLGVLLRVWGYLLNRTYWLDEGTLLSNLTGTAICDFSSHLRGDQLAPFGFLIIERIMVNLLGNSGYATRFVPLVCGIVALWLFKLLAFRRMSPSAALVASALFAFSDDLIDYSSEPGIAHPALAGRRRDREVPVSWPFDSRAGSLVPPLDRRGRGLVAGSARADGSCGRSGPASHISLLDHPLPRPGKPRSLFQRPRRSARQPVRALVDDAGALLKTAWSRGGDQGPRFATIRTAAESTSRLEGSLLN